VRKQASYPRSCHRAIGASPLRLFQGGSWIRWLDPRIILGGRYGPPKIRRLGFQRPRSDLNARPLAPQASALSAELRGQLRLAGEAPCSRWTAAPSLGRCRIRPIATWRGGRDSNPR
jgi:hypothetical protein